MFSDHHKPDISNASASQESNTSNPKKDMEKLSKKKMLSACVALKHLQNL